MQINGKSEDNGTAEDVLDAIRQLTNLATAAKQTIPAAQASLEKVRSHLTLLSETYRDARQTLRALAIQRNDIQYSLSCGQLLESLKSPTPENINCALPSDLSGVLQIQNVLPPQYLKGLPVSQILPDLPDEIPVGIGVKFSYNGVSYEGFIVFSVGQYFGENQIQLLLTHGPRLVGISPLSDVPVTVMESFLNDLLTKQLSGYSGALPPISPDFSLNYFCCRVDNGAAAILATITTSFPRTAMRYVDSIPIFTKGFVKFSIPLLLELVKIVATKYAQANPIPFVTFKGEVDLAQVNGVPDDNNVFDSSNGFILMQAPIDISIMGITITTIPLYLRLYAEAGDTGAFQLALDWYHIGIRWQWQGFDSGVVIDLGPWERIYTSKIKWPDNFKPSGYVVSNEALYLVS